MAYRLEIPERTERQIDGCIGYIADVLNNPSAAEAVLTDIEHAWGRLEQFPESFGLCDDPYLEAKEYRKLPLQKHDYIFIYRIDGNTVYVAGLFHMLENYRDKL